MNRASAPERSAADYLPHQLSLKRLREAAAECEGCPLYQQATQTVFGEGPVRAPLMLIGEQPGDEEDRTGHPFVGPSGRELDDALAAAGIERGEVYVTNAVKHFKFEARGKRRLHKKPSSRELAACRPWLDAEFQVLEPDVVVCLGATAAQSLLGRTFRLTEQHGEFIATDVCEYTMATYHPSAILRGPDRARRAQLREILIEDLRKASAALRRLHRKRPHAGR